MTLSTELCDKVYRIQNNGKKKLNFFLKILNFKIFFFEKNLHVYVYRILKWSQLGTGFGKLLEIF
jgi:hypothetical protein